MTPRIIATILVIFTFLNTGCSNSRLQVNEEIFQAIETTTKKIQDIDEVLRLADTSKEAIVVLKEFENTLRYYKSENTRLKLKYPEFLPINDINAPELRPSIEKLGLAIAQLMPKIPTATLRFGEDPQFREMIDRLDKLVNP